jgi:tRNA threonylcarbamoyladenosine biosynthesis protein TsaB
MAEQLRVAGWRPSDVELVTVTHGPGSFTGLRIGVTAAKTFAFAVSAEVIGINTLDVVAAQSTQAVDALWAVIDAQRNQLFAARYERDANGQWQVTRETETVDCGVWIGLLDGADGVTGPGLRRVQDLLRPGVAVEREENWGPRASVVGQLACRRYEGGETGDVWALMPHYFRKSAAEEKYEARRANPSDA